MFITFEGGEGSGKTTIIKKLEKLLIDKGYDVIVTREPGGSKISEKIRTLLLDNQYQGNITPETEALLFAASRGQHLNDIILPALKSKKIVLCDRYVDSSLAYQGYARNLGFDFIKKVNTYALKHSPDITFYLDLDPNIGLQRINNRNNLNRLDKENILFHNKVRQGYLKLCKKYKKRLVKINADDTPDNITNNIYTKIIKLYEKSS